MIPISKSEKRWTNPSGAYNTGIRFATKDVVILQNAEVMHCGDILAFTDQHIQPRDWLTFSCYGLSAECTEKFTELESGQYEYIKQLPDRIGGNSVKREDVGGWLNHPEKHFVAYHYCGAIYREDLVQLMSGGFSEKFYTLLGGDDDEFIKRLIFKGFRFKIPNFAPDSPFTVHQFHPRSEALKAASYIELEKTKLELAKALLQMGFEPEVDIHLAPPSETPSARKQAL